MSTGGWSAIEWETLRWAVSSRNAAWWNVVATLLGSLATLLAVVAALGIPLWQRRLDRRDKLSASAFAPYVKLNTIYSVTIIIRRHLERGMLEHARDLSKPAWLQVEALNQLATPLHFSTDELWALARAGDNRLINEVGDLDQSFNGILWSMERYDRLREEIGKEFSPESLRGNVATIAFTQDQYLRLAPRFIVMDSILKQITPITNRLAWDTFRALELLALDKRRPLGAKFRMELPDPDGHPVIFSAPGKGGGSR